jgi:glycosyltransferase involved in cell wall biosynthesis
MSAPGPLRTLQVIEATGAGVGRHVRALSAFLRDEGHDVTVAYAPARMDAEFRRFVADPGPGIRLLPLALERDVAPAADVAGVRALARLVRREGPFDVIHGHSSKGGAVARLAGRLTGAPVVYTPHSLVMASPDLAPAKRRFDHLVELVLGRAATARMIAVSDDERRLMVRLGLARPDRVVVVNNGLDEEAFERFAAPRPVRTPTPERPLTLGSVMRFDAQKAPGDLVEAFARLVRARPGAPVRLVVAGDGELLDATRRQVGDAGLEDRVELPGWRSDVADVLAGFDVFVLSSRYEGFSYAILEAMAARLPVVCTDVFGVGDTVARVPGNVVVPAGAPGALADGLRSVVDRALDPASGTALVEVGRANHDHARGHFTQRETMRGVVDVYADVAVSAGRRRARRSGAGRAAPGPRRGWRSPSRGARRPSTPGS